MFALRVNETRCKPRYPNSLRNNRERERKGDARRFDEEKHEHRDPHAVLPPPRLGVDAREVTHNGEHREHKRIHPHEELVHLSRPETSLERREEGELDPDGADAAEGERGANVALGEAEAAEGDAGVAEEDENGVEGDAFEGEESLVGVQGSVGGFSEQRGMERTNVDPQDDSDGSSVEVTEWRRLDDFFFLFRLGPTEYWGHRSEGGGDLDGDGRRVSSEEDFSLDGDWTFSGCQRLARETKC